MLQPTAVPDLSDSQLPALTKTLTRVRVMQGQKERLFGIPPKKNSYGCFRGPGLQGFAW